MAFETVTFDIVDRVATITLNRPERLNALNAAMHRDLRACWSTVTEDPDIWVAIVTGAGAAFSTGADVEGLAAGGVPKPDPWRQLSMQEVVRALPTPRRMHVHKPVIAAVNGVVAGVALDLVTEADIPIASTAATFTDPHVSLGYVSSHEMVNLSRRVPLAVCLRMALMGRHERLSAQRAYEIGLVTEVVAPEQLLPRAREIAQILLKNAPLAMYGTKMGLLRGLGLPPEQAEELAVGYLEVVEQSEDHQEGPRAFIEKRDPVWKAR
jgi:enoyl-CoA hydratase/carnithine racemase